MEFSALHEDDVQVTKLFFLPEQVSSAHSTLLHRQFSLYLLFICIFQNLLSKSRNGVGDHLGKESLQLGQITVKETCPPMAEINSNTIKSFSMIR